jgi:ribose 5-phosphate isomerase A
MTFTNSPVRTHHEIWRKRLLTDARALKIEAARAALEYVQDGMRLGIGTGSTADEFIRLLAKKVSGGLTIIGVPTSERSAALCGALGIPLATLDQVPELDLAIDGTDEIDPDFNLIKGAGGALLREKIVAATAHTMLIIADESKVVETLGKFPLPIEVNPFGLTATILAIEKAANTLGLSGAVTLRVNEGMTFVTDGGHLILDASFGRIPDAKALSMALHAIPGVVEHGLFLEMATVAIIAGSNGIRTLKK